MKLNLEKRKSLHWLGDSIVEWWTPDENEFPWRTADRAAWQALVTEVLLQRTHAQAVAKIYLDFFARFPTPEALAVATEEDVREAISTLGLTWRAKFLPQLGASVVDGVPDTIDELTGLPGVGPYVAAAYLTMFRQRAAPFVDANVVRLLGRFLGFDWDGETRRKRWFLDLADVFFAHNHDPATFGYAVLDFSREVCGTRPRCIDCPMRIRCASAQLEAPTEVT